MRGRCDGCGCGLDCRVCRRTITLSARPVEPDTKVCGNGTKLFEFAEQYEVSVEFTVRKVGHTVVLELHGDFSFDQVKFFAHYFLGLRVHH